MEFKNKRGKIDKIIFLAAMMALFFVPAAEAANQACSPGVHAGCALCNSTGTAWTNDDSMCGNGKVCQNWACVDMGASVKSMVDRSGCNRITGWVCDPNDANTPFQTQFYLDNTLNGYLGWTEANINPPGLSQYIASLCGASGAHYFNFAIPAATQNGRTVADGASHDVHIVGMKNNNDWYVLDGSPKTIQCNLFATNVACLGDSITYGAGLQESDTYCYKLRQSGYQTQNYGVSGNTTVDILSRMSEVIGKGYKYTVLMVGTNDMYSLVTGYGTDLPTYYNNLLNIAQQLKNDKQQVVISTIPPCNEWTGHNCKIGDQTGTILRNNVIRRISYDKNLCYADIFSGVFNGDFNSAQFQPSDVLHPNAQANSQMAPLYAAAIANCKPFDCNAHPADCYNFTLACTLNCSGKSCGDDGCGGSCGSCAGGQTCFNGACAAACTSKTCLGLGYNCGSVSDGCGKTLNCGTCRASQTCAANVCVANACIPKTCQSLSYNCGAASDGCGKTLSCGGCLISQTCTNGQCVSSPVCIPKTCANLGYSCGKTGDGCGSVLDCGTCALNQSCSNGACVAGFTCVPKTCASVGYSCGKTDDGCGSVLDCGNCPADQECVSNACQANALTQTTDNADATLANLYAQIEYLQNEIARVQALLATKNPISCSSINHNLSYGMKNDPQVKCLQEFLKTKGFFSASATGNYYTLTKNAVAAFQSRYGDDLLIPYGLNQGSGNVDDATRDKINQILTGK